MTLMRHNPFRDLLALSDRLSRLAEDSTMSLANEGDFLTGSWSPAVDIFETDNAIVLKAELPGMTEKDIDLTVDRNLLTIKGERQFENEVNKDNYHRVERAYGSFMRSFQLPATVDTTKVQAEQKNGILTVTLPKKEEEKPKKINIKIK
jgi:HSP20 family protein